MNDIQPRDQERPSVIEARELIPFLVIVYGVTLLLALLA